MRSSASERRSSAGIEAPKDVSPCRIPHPSASPVRWRSAAAVDWAASSRWRLPPVTAKLVVNGTGKSGDRSADAVVDEIRRASGQAVAMIGSVTDRGWVGSMVAEVVARWDRVDILVNNAGFVIDRSFVKLDLEDFEAVLNVHLMGAVNCTRAV